jgi:hypothetical protein
VVSKNTEIATLQDYAISKLGNAAITDLIENNLGGERLTIKDIPKVKIPAGGSATWLAPRRRSS